MANERYVGLVAVGVDRTRLLTELQGAAAGARRMADWLKRQEGFAVVTDIKVLADGDGREVKARDIQDAARELVEAGGLDLLVLYFSGHGMVKSGGDEQVLLSGVKAYPDEAISIAATAANARYLGVPHVVIISDACRNVADPFGPLGQVSGKPAVQRGPVAGVKPGKVDVFYATEPSQTAKEHQGDGFFTRILLEVLDDCPAEVCNKWDGIPAPVITTWGLEDYLYREVPDRAQKEVPPFEQTPDIVVTAHEPLFFGYARPRQKAAPPVVPPGGPPGPGGFGFGIRLDTLDVDVLDAPAAPVAPAAPAIVPPPATMPRNQALDAVSQELRRWGGGLVPEDLLADAGLMDAVRSHLGMNAARTHFETGTGYTVIGAGVARVVAGANEHCDLLREGDRLSIRLKGNVVPGMPTSIIVVFDGGTAAMLPVMPGYAGTVQVEGGLVRSLSLDLNDADRARLHESEADRQRFEQRRAIAAAFASSGKLRKLAGEEASTFAMLVRESKRLDPCLGVYAAYAYALAGDEAGARSVYEYIKASWKDDYITPRPAPVPFDVALLAGALRDPNERTAVAIAPACPMMSLGWSLLSAHAGDYRLHPALYEAGRRRLNAEWTTFPADAAAAVIQAFEKGDIL